MRRGVLNKSLEELELYRVTGLQAEQPLVLRPSHWNVTSSQHRYFAGRSPFFAPQGERAGPRADPFSCQECRTKKRVRAIDFHEPVMKEPESTVPRADGGRAPKTAGLASELWHRMEYVLDRRRMPRVQAPLAKTHASRAGRSRRTRRGITTRCGGAQTARKTDELVA